MKIYNFINKIWKRLIKLENFLKMKTIQMKKKNFNLLMIALNMK